MAAITDPFSGEETFNAEPARVFNVLSDLDQLSKAVPGLVSAERVDAKSLKCVIKPGLSFLGPSVKATITLAEAVPHSRVVQKIAVSGIGMGMQIEAVMDIHSADAGKSKLAWTARVTELSGLVKAAPVALVRAAADKVIKDGWQSLRERVEG